MCSDTRNCAHVSADQRLTGSIAAAVIAYEHGASILRVHDVKETVEALTVAQAVLKGR